MNTWHNLARLACGVLLVSAAFATASREPLLRIKILSAESHRTNLSPDQSPQECDLANYSGYCHGTRLQQEQNLMLVQTGDGEPFRVMCTVDTRWSKCTLLPVGAAFDARREKHGITVFFVNDEGKPRRQLYTLVAQNEKANPVPTPILGQTALSPAPEPGQASSQAMTGNRLETVRCTFRSTPPGAEITLDGRYFGNTPSVLGLTTGTQIVVLFAEGFAPWKKELTLSPGSEVTVDASLQKLQ